MKIFNQSAFIFGLFCAGGLILFALGIVSVHWWQWIFTIALAGRYLYIGLSESASKKADTIHRHYHETAIKLYGKLYRVKTNLPWILLIVFSGSALWSRLAFDKTIPVGAAVAFCVLLTISAAYSLGIEREIKKTIERQQEK